MTRYGWRLFAATLVLTLCYQVNHLQAQGLVVPGAGAVNRSMGGASTAAAVDPAGAGYWNPATIRALPGNQIGFGAELIYADTHLSSAGPLAAGSNFSNSGLPALPTIGMVYHSQQMPVTFGLGIYALLGGGVNFPQAANNPLLNSTGPVYASASALAIQPAASVQVTDRLAVGFAPIISMISMGVNPAFFAPNGPGNFPIATPGRPSWGAGFAVGTLYEVNPCWSFGAAYKSPVWYEKLRYNAQDGAGNPRKITLLQDMPQIISIGAAYHGFERLTLAADVRYLDYANTKLWGDSIPSPGLAWDSVFAVALGAEYNLTPRTALRAGFVANENPIPAPATLFNVQLPTINQYQLAVGGSWKMTPVITFDWAALYGLPSNSTGPIPLPVGGQANVSMDQDLVSASMGMRIDF